MGDPYVFECPRCKEIFDGPPNSIEKRKVFVYEFDENVLLKATFEKILKNLVERKIITKEQLETSKPAGVLFEEKEVFKEKHGQRFSLEI